MGELINNYLEAYINLVIVFYRKLNERALEFSNISSISLNDVANFQPKEEHYLFFEIHNFLVKSLKNIGQINLGNSEVLESYIDRLARNILVMQLMTGILIDERNPDNYKFFQEIEESEANIFIDVDSYLRKWLYSLKNKYTEGVVRN